MGATLATACFDSASGECARFDLSMSLLEEHNASGHDQNNQTRDGDPLQMYKSASSNRLSLQQQQDQVGAACAASQAHENANANANANGKRTKPTLTTMWSRTTSGTTSEESSSVEPEEDDLSPCHREQTNQQPETDTANQPTNKSLPRPCSSSSLDGFSTGKFEKCYELEEVIGVGTTSKCYKCRRLVDNAMFACKVIDKRRLGYDQNQKARILQQLRREITVLQRLHHQNIAQLEEAFETENFIVLVMEWLRGGELFDAIVERGHLDEMEAKRVARSILSALSYLHEQGVVHRDIKAENLLLSSNDHHTMEVKLIDFGFAKVIPEGETTNSFLGTGGYLAPEILQHREYTDSVDLWSFGVILYLTLCGRLPFRASTCLRPNQKISSLYRLTFPEKYWKNISLEARDLVKRILVLNPADRMSAEEALGHPWFSQ